MLDGLAPETCNFALLNRLLFIPLPPRDIICRLLRGSTAAATAGFAFSGRALMPTFGSLFFWKNSLSKVRGFFVVDRVVVTAAARGCDSTDFLSLPPGCLGASALAAAASCAAVKSVLAVWQRKHCVLLAKTTILHFGQCQSPPSELLPPGAAEAPPFVRFPTNPFTTFSFLPPCPSTAFRACFAAAVHAAAASPPTNLPFSTFPEAGAPASAGPALPAAAFCAAFHAWWHMATSLSLELPGVKIAAGAQCSHRAREHTLISTSGPPLFPAAPVLIMPRFFFFSSLEMLILGRCDEACSRPRIRA